MLLILEACEVGMKISILMDDIHLVLFSVWRLSDFTPEVYLGKEFQKILQRRHGGEKYVTRRKVESLVRT